MKPHCRYPALFIAVGLGLLLGACGEKADFSYSNGQPGRYADFSGQWLLINYWAEWCKPCIKEIPELNSVAESADNIRVIGVNFDQMPIETEQALIKKLGIRFAVVRAPLHQHFGFAMPASLPTTVVISPEGTIHKILLGPQTAETLSQAITTP